MRSGSNVQLASLRNRDLELQTTSPFSNHGSVERSTACCRHKNVLHIWMFQKFPFFWVSLYYDPKFKKKHTHTMLLIYEEKLVKQIKEKWLLITRIIENRPKIH
jgi:hypothetical protein